jgi:thioredoxin-like negative regulator of GroEL
MSELFVAHGRFNASVRILEGLVSANPRNRTARFKLAQVLTWTGQFDPAMNHYRILLEEKR